MFESVAYLQHYMGVTKVIHKILQRKFFKQMTSILLVSGSLCASNVNAFEIENDGWTFSVNGNINVGYIYTSCDDAGAAVVLGSFTCGGGNLLGNGQEDVSTISNGYLPTIIEFGVATNRGGYDISANFTFDRGLDQNQSFNGPTDSDEGFRIWLTLGNESIGTILAGRQWGLFAYDVTFADMSVLGVGANFISHSPINTSLGAAGTGYVFLDRITQVTWTLPTSDAWVAQIGAFQPLDLSSFSFNSGAFAGADSGSEFPGFHGRLRYNFAQGYISSTMLTQPVDIAGGGPTYQAYAIDVTAQFNINDFQFTGSYYTAEGVGHTGFFIDAVDATGLERESDGYLVQGTYTAGSTKFGLNYGVSNLDANPADIVVGSLQIEEKSKITAGIYHTLTSGIILVGEYSHIEAENISSGEVENDVANLGLILFF